MEIKNNVINKIEIKKSIFITYLFKVNKIEEIDKYLNDVKKEVKNPTHICYAYLLDDKEKFDDDNEPYKSAGYPMLQMLKKRKLNNVLAVVVRYFGGIKLGLGGLTRAYSKSVSEALKLAHIQKAINFIYYDFTTDYETYHKIEHLLKEHLEVISYQKEIKIKIKIDETKKKMFENILKKNKIKYDQYSSK